MRTSIVLTALALLAAPTAYGESNARVQRGHALFDRHCAACHGATGGERGPIAVERGLTPPDLRRFAARRDGRFDPREVAMIIDGRDARLVSAQRQMPIWGDLHADLRARSAELGEGMSDEMDALVAWIESIQLAH